MGNVEYYGASGGVKLAVVTEDPSVKLNLRVNERVLISPLKRM